jgi:type IV secretory pathway protease TraF
MTIITLELPDDIAKQAQHKGLLSSAVITALLKQVLAQQQQTLSLVDVMQKSPHKDIEIMQEMPAHLPIRDVSL